MKDTWNRLAKENGLPEFFFFGLCQGEHRFAKVSAMGYDAIVYEHMPTVYKQIKVTLIQTALRHYCHKPVTLAYSKYVNEAIGYFNNHPSLVPCLLPNFDHSPRSAHNGIILRNNTPEKWYRLCSEVKKMVEKGNGKDCLLFIKSWNEWGEGNYLEPDAEFGKQYIEMTKKALE